MFTSTMECRPELSGVQTSYAFNKNNTKRVRNVVYAERDTMFNEGENIENTSGQWDQQRKVFSVVI